MQESDYFDDPILNEASKLPPAATLDPSAGSVDLDLTNIESLALGKPNVSLIEIIRYFNRILMVDFSSVRIKYI